MSVKGQFELSSKERFASLARGLLFLFLSVLSISAIADSRGPTVFWITPLATILSAGFLIESARFYNSRKPWLLIESDHISVRGYSGLNLKSIPFSGLRNIRVKSRGKQKKWLFVTFRIPQSNNKRTCVIWLNDFDLPEVLLKQILWIRDHHSEQEDGWDSTDAAGHSPEKPL